MRRVIAVGLLLFSISISAEAGLLRAGTWSLDPSRSSVTFTVVKLGREVVHGRFDSFNGVIHYDGDHPERSRVQWQVQLRSVETGEPNRDRALQSPQYFDTARYPQMSFVSRSVHRLPDQRLAIRGHLTIRGVTKPLTVYARITENGNDSAVAETRFTVDRLEYGVVGGTTLRRAISRMVEVRIVAAGTHVGNGGR